MPTISEILAAKAAKKAGPVENTPELFSPVWNGIGKPGSMTPVPPTIAAMITSEKEVEAAIDRIDPPGKSLVLSRQSEASNATKGEPRGQRSEIHAELPAERSLSETTGEGVKTIPLEATPAEALWIHAMSGFESELCIMTDPTDPESAWLAVRIGEEFPPILLHRLPFYEHPKTQRSPNEPF